MTGAKETGARSASPPEGKSGLDVAGRQVVVVGLAASGLAATRALTGLGAAVRVTEALPRTEVADVAREAEGMGAEVLAGGHSPDHLLGADLLVASPGVPEGADILRWAREGDISVWSEVEVGARLVRCPYVAITGTNGKTTTTEMLASAMRATGLDAVACGNVGHPFTLAATEGHEALAVEVSSFQLRFHESLHPRVSVLLNLAPDHLDWHPDLEAYREAKERVYARQGRDDVHVGNRDDPEAAAVSRAAPTRRVWFTLGEPAEGEVGYVRGELTARLDLERRLGPLADEAPTHRADAAAAAAAGLAFGLDPEAVGAALRTFAPLPHRGQTVARAGGVAFVDDSKATNPHAALASLEGRDGVVLIAGGRAKGVDLSPMGRAARRLRGAVLVGEAALELAAILGGRVPTVRAETMEEAVAAAYELAAGEGTVLLAPACASQDMFRDYRERGKRFAEAARRLAEGSRDG